MIAPVMKDNFQDSRINAVLRLF